MKKLIINLVSRVNALQMIARKAAHLYLDSVIKNLEKQVREITESRVAAGPFKGLEYPSLPSSNVHTSIIPKLLGIYERELYPAFDRLLAHHKYDRFIDIGAAEGYYVAGFAMRSPDSTVIAFEVDENLQGSLQMVCSVNGVAKQVDVRGFCEPEDLLRLGPAQRTLLLCDCEGGEIELITTRTIAGLGPCDMIVECHDMYVEDCTSKLASLLESTHEVEIVTSHERTLSDLPPDLSSTLAGRPDEIEYAIGEHRHFVMNWIIATQR